MYNEIEGDLISLSLLGNFDVIAHGCNCQRIMGAGIALQMAKTFGCDKYKLEDKVYKGNINKLGRIDYHRVFINLEDKKITFHHWHNGVNGVIFYEKNYPVFETKAGKEVYRKTHTDLHKLLVVNAYTQYQPGPNLDYDALTLCLRKINHAFKGKHIGLPQIGAGIAGGDWNRIKTIIQQELKDCNVTVVIYNK